MAAIKASSPLQANVELQSEHNFGVMVTARARGRTGLKVALRATDLRGGQLAGNLLELTDEIQIQVRARLRRTHGCVFAGLAPAKKKTKKNRRQKSVNTFCSCLKCLAHCRCIF